MQNRNQAQNTKVPLLVKEIILPDIKKSSPSLTCNTFSLLGSNSCNVEETREDASSSLKIGYHEIKPVRGLISLTKNYQEDYFRGTRKKHHSRKRVKHERVNSFLNDLSFKESQDDCEGSKIPKPKEDSLSLEEIIERINLQQKIQSYEKMKEHYKRCNEIKQRLAEETYIKQQENLVKKWGKIIKRNNKLKQDNLHDLEPHYKETCCNKRITTSGIAEKFWDDDRESKSLKKTKKKSEFALEVDDLEEVFGKLVFIDNKSDEELETSYSRKKM